MGYIGFRNLADELQVRTIEIKELATQTPAEVADKSSDEEKLQGTWRAISMESNGVKTDIANPNLPMLFDITWTFTDDKLAMSIIDRKTGKPTDPALPAVFHLNPRIAPKQISIIASLPEPGGYGIYRLEGDTLTVCYFTALPKGVAFPADFSGKAGSSTTLLVFKREKPGQSKKSQP
jgi:uncharacterized protein (TIGR03067 family)